MTTVATPTPTAEQYRQLKHYFEGTRTLPQLLATLRSRRVGLGYSIESGQAETRGATGRTLQQQRGPLAFVSEHPTLPLSEVEEAILAWSACGPNGLVHWDIAVHGGFHELVHIAGRTAVSPGNSFATDLLVIKDQGAFLYNPGTERERMVEIQGEDDYHKVLDWYRRGMHNLFDAWHLYFTDDQTGEPAGVGEWVGEGKLEFPITIGQIEQFIFQVET